MNEEYKKFPENSKVWVYQSSRLLDDDDVNFLKVRIDDFVTNWESHGSLLKADFDVFNQLFVVFFVDEQGDRMCGSAQDRAVRLMKELEQELEVEFLNRMNLAYLKNNVATVVKMNDFGSLYGNGEITDDTIVFNNTITTKKEFDTVWKTPLKNSWHKQLVDLV
ncbi:MAG: hypothetical protein AB7O47_12675 [Flavobacteriales bacterium]